MSHGEGTGEARYEVSLALEFLGGSSVVLAQPQAWQGPCICPDQGVHTVWNWQYAQCLLLHIQLMLCAVFQD